MKHLGLIIAIICGGLLLYASSFLPAWGDPHSPASEYVSPRYIEEGFQETDVPNLVTAVLADYRGYDTLFETTVIFTAGLACVLLIRTFKKGTETTHHTEDSANLPQEPEDSESTGNMEVPYDLIVRTVCGVLIPFIQLFALYVVAHGDFSLGGGFQGGVIFGSSIILLAISFDLRSALKKLSERWIGILSALGVFIYAGIGALCFSLGGKFLDYGKLAKILPVDPVYARALGMLGVEIGVAFAVMAVMAAIYINLASDGRHEEGL